MMSKTRTRTVCFTVVSVLVLSMAALVASCARPAPSAPSPGAGPAPAPDVKPIKMRYSGGQPPTHHMSISQKWFAEEVGKRTNGKVVIEAYLAGELYGHAEVIDAVSTGAIEMGYSSGGMFAARNPVHGFYNYFFMLPSLSQYERARDQLAGVLFPLMEKDNVKPLHWFGYGDTAYAGRKPLVKPADIKGLVINGPNPPSNAFLKLLGAVPAPMDSTEVYDAMSKGALDGTITGWGSIYSRKFYEIAPHFTGSFWTSTWMAFMNLKTWNSLPAQTQQVIMAVAREAEQMSFKEAIDYDNKSIETLKKSGNLTILSSGQLTAWVDFVRPYYDTWIQASEKAGYGAQAQAILKIVQAAK